MSQIQQKIVIFKSLDRLVDIVLLFGAVRLSVMVEQVFHRLAWYNWDPNSFKVIAVPIIVIIWWFVISKIEKHTLYRTISYRKLILNVSLITVIGSMVLIFIDFMLKSHFFYRSSIIAFTMLSFGFLIVKRFIMKFYLSSIRRAGKDSKNIMIVGCNMRTTQLINEIQHHAEYGLHIKSIVKINDDEYNIKHHEIAVTKIENIEKTIFENAIDEVFFAESIDNIANVEQVLSYFQSIGVSYHILVNFASFNLEINEMRLTPVFKEHYGMPTISFNAVDSDLYKLYIKNFWERSFAIVLIIGLSPIFLLIAIIIKLTSKGSTIFSQDRVGLHGRIFQQYKFRSMVIDADSKKEELQHLNELSGPVFKNSNDPRITPIGKYIRKYSIDELPQLFNVVYGDMNLIGPRPPIPEEVKQYKPNHMRRLSVKPGITGLWQVEGRNDIHDFDEWVKLDLQYIDNWSLWGDIKIAFKTIPTILKGSGK